MPTTLNADGVDRLPRRSASRADGAQRTVIELETRLLSLADSNTSARVRALSMSEPAAPDAPLSVLAWLRPASMRLRSLTVQVPLWLTVFALVAASYALHSRSASAPKAPAAPPAAASFTASATGSDRLLVLVTAGDNALSVGVHPTIAGSRDWFWCLESDRPLAAEQHVCGSAGTLDPASGYVQTSGGLRVDADLAQDATFFVQMFCPTGCQWRVAVASGPAEGATLP